MSSRILLAYILPALFVSTHQAAEPKGFELGEVVITADAETGADAMASRITTGDIRKFERTDLSEALRLSPGVVTNSNGPRNKAGVYVRGFDLRQTPVFIDGIPTAFLAVAALGQADNLFHRPHTARQGHLH